ncbi:hypothetical protein LF1_40630 [Rubripirellula obstinata]|uniref:Uncharacterized protein n=1 Tax=Rubripirellula obstinata TaxID=406547 RepID=A0A5B1CQ60_9BACT|nr:hypothetical protein [Rubripirellula obstinata]KAA1261513.1 hypothetical protein LF1_40630 [Rubripirellula obstinata]
MNKLIQASGACLMLVLPTPMVGAKESSKETADVKSTTAELSVPPLDHIAYPMSRPDWCDAEPDFTQPDHKIVVTAGPCDSADQCDEQLKWMQRAAVVTYANGIVDSPSEFDLSSLSDQDIDDKVISRRYEGPVTVGGETKYEKVVQLAFTPKIRDQIHEAARGIEVRRRLGFLAFAGVVGTTLLVCSSGLLGIASRRVSRRTAAIP